MTRNIQINIFLIGRGKKHLVSNRHAHVCIRASMYYKLQTCAEYVLLLKPHRGKRSVQACLSTNAMRSSSSSLPCSSSQILWRVNKATMALYETFISSLIHRGPWGDGAAKQRSTWELEETACDTVHHLPASIPCRTARSTRVASCCGRGKIKRCLCFLQGA